MSETTSENRLLDAETDPFPLLDAHGVTGRQEITKLALVRLLTNRRLLTKDERTNLDRGCLGLVCLSSDHRKPTFLFHRRHSTAVVPRKSIVRVAGKGTGGDLAVDPPQSGLRFGK